MAPVRDVRATQGIEFTAKMTRPAGTTGRVGCGTGWMRRPCRTQIHSQSVFNRSLPRT